jgi:sulfide:quinone oxidoreductase
VQANATGTIARQNSPQRVGVVFLAISQTPPRSVNWSHQGRWVHMAEVGFEKYFLREARNVSSELGSERS